MALDVARVQAGQQKLSATPGQAPVRAAGRDHPAGRGGPGPPAAPRPPAPSPRRPWPRSRGRLAQQIAQQAAAQAAAAAKAASSATSAARGPGRGGRGLRGRPGGQHGQRRQPGRGQRAPAAANQAAGRAGGATFCYGGSPTAAGLAAVHAAMQYLGVPYVWGGASSSGRRLLGPHHAGLGQAGVSMAHSAADQYAEFHPCEPERARARRPALLRLRRNAVSITSSCTWVPRSTVRPPRTAAAPSSRPPTPAPWSPSTRVWSEGFVGAARP